jgi:hypothetical protein
MRCTSAIVAAALILGNAIAALCGETSDRLVHISVVPMVASEHFDHVEMKLQPADDADAPARIIRFEGDSVDVSLPLNTHWWTSTSARGWWSARTLLSVTSGEGPMTFESRLWPAGKLRGTLKVLKAADKLPAALTVSARAVPGTPPRSLPDFVIDCPVERSGRWQCDIPIGSHDLSLAAASYIPVYRWDVRVDRDAPRDLGTMTLRKGASVAGWAAIDERGAKLTGTRAVLTRLVAAGGDARVIERLSSPVALATVAANGFFQLTGVEAGTYRVRVERDGFAPASLFPVRVFAGSETLIRHPLMLQRPLHVRANVQPARDASGKPWRMTISRIGDFSTAPDGGPIFDAPIGEDGEATVAGQAPGTFRATVADSAGNPYDTRNFDVQSDNDAPQHFDIAVVSVTGHIHRGDEPVVAALSFGGRFGSVHVTTESAADGSFTVRLPRDGHWPIDVEADPDLRTTLETDIQADSNHEAEVELTLNDNRVHGRVLSETDAPVASALVFLATRGRTLTTTTATDGTFAYSGVMSGPARLTAEIGRTGAARHSDEATIEIPATGATNPVELRLQRDRHIVASVTSIRGPVAGAIVEVVVPPPAPAPFIARMTTDLEGTFELNPPVSLASATAIVLPPGLALRAFTLPLDGRELVLNVPESGGTLRIVTSEPLTAYSFMMVTQDGRAIPARDIMSWAGNHGIHPTEHGIDVPDVAAGVYRVCVGRATEAPECSEGSLAPGSLLELRLAPSHSSHPSN